MSDPAASCDELAELPCVFILALGRSGSSHLIRILHSIPGYRISGETDNAWLYLARFARLTQSFEQRKARAHNAALNGQQGFKAKLPFCETWPPYYQRAGARAANLTARCKAKVRCRVSKVLPRIENAHADPFCRARWTIHRDLTNQPVSLRVRRPEKLSTATASCHGNAAAHEAWSERNWRTIVQSLAAHAC